MDHYTDWYIFVANAAEKKSFIEDISRNKKENPMKERERKKVECRKWEKWIITTTREKNRA